MKKAFKKKHVVSSYIVKTIARTGQQEHHHSPYLFNQNPSPPPKRASRSLLRVRRTPVTAHTASHLAGLAALVAIRVVAGPREGRALAGQEEGRGGKAGRVVRAEGVGAGALAVVGAGVAGTVAHAPEVEVAAREDDVVVVAGAGDGDGEAVPVRCGWLVHMILSLEVTG